jgi:hypothetical protein
MARGDSAGRDAVTPWNALQIRNALQAESDRLIAKLKLDQPSLRVPLLIQAG